ncbi:MAG: LPS export ABC transporter periplasmic protein LptC [Pseudomonadota bacterium]
MAGVRDAYSRAVSVLRILLPLGALALLSTLFLFARNVETDLSIPYADVDVNEVARSQRLAQPEYSTVLNDGTALLLRAVTARPDPERQGVILANAIDADITLPDTRLADVVSETGWLDPARDRMELRGDVVATLSDGSELRTELLEADMVAGTLFSPVPVAVFLPQGRIDGANMRLERPEMSRTFTRAVFKGGVKVVFMPQR